MGKRASSQEVLQPNVSGSWRALTSARQTMEQKHLLGTRSTRPSRRGSECGPDHTAYESSHGAQRRKGRKRARSESTNLQPDAQHSAGTTQRTPQAEVGLSRAFGGPNFVRGSPVDPEPVEGRVVSSARLPRGNADEDANSTDSAVAALLFLAGPVLATSAAGAAGDAPQAGVETPSAYEDAEDREEEEVLQGRFGNRAHRAAYAGCGAAMVAAVEQQAQSMGLSTSYVWRAIAEFGPAEVKTAFSGAFSPGANRGFANAAANGAVVDRIVQILNTCGRDELDNIVARLGGVSSLLVGVMRAGGTLEQIRAISISNEELVSKRASMGSAEPFAPREDQN